MVCFIILHYMVLEETVLCINSIKKLNGDFRMVIVDNCSSNGSGMELYRTYEMDPQIFVFLNTENEGFARGNNIGCKIAKKLYDPDFYVVMNNDVEICQKDFLARVYKIWNEEHFDILGPDVYSTAGKFHQSPKGMEKLTLEKARKLRSIYDSKRKSRFIVPLRCYLKQIKGLKYFYHQIKQKALKIDYSQKYENVPLHGSCLIFSKEFINKRDYVFFSETFFYFESEILDYECEIVGFKEIYDPSIKVLHHQNISTNLTYKNELKKVRFMNEQLYLSITAFIKKYGR